MSLMSLVARFAHGNYPMVGMSGAFGSSPLQIGSCREVLA